MKRSQQRATEGRFIAAQIRAAERAGVKQQVIADSLGINVRTVRKIKTGETSGRAIYKSRMREPNRPAADVNTFNAEFIVGKDANGNDVYASRNVIIPDIHGAKGYRTPTPFDAWRTNLGSVIAAERAALARKYNVEAFSDESDESYAFVPCGRRYCRHEYDEHGDGSDGGHCNECRCPAFLAPGSTARLRVIHSHRRKAIQLVTGW